MKLEIDLFLSTDNLWLPGLLYRHETTTKKVMIWLHGMGDSAVFYSLPRINALGAALADRSIALFAFNNRGAHNVKTLKQEVGPEETRETGRYRAGTYFELIEDCVQDINGAVEYLKKQGFQEFYLGGHSSGANKICAYDNIEKNNSFNKYVLAGPGDDTGIFFSELGPKRFWAALKYAAEAVTNGDSLRLMPKYTGMHPFSTQSAWDILNPDGAYNTFPFYEETSERIGEKPLFEEYHSVDKPTLIIFGDQDEYTFTAGNTQKALDLFMKHTSNAMLKANEFQIVKDTDHGFHNRESEFAEQVAEWLARV